jgi:hypothetical protein
MAMHFPANAGLIFLTDELTNDRFLVDTGATLSTIPCTSNSSPSGPLLKGADGQPIPSWGFIQRTVQYQGKLFISSFLEAAVAGPILGIDFLRKFKVKVVPETSHVLFACTTAASSVPPHLPSSVLGAVLLYARLTSSQPPAISAQLVRNPEVKSFSFSVRNDQSLLDLAPSVQVIPEFVSADMKLLLQKQSSILRTGDVMPKPTHGAEHHIHTGSHPPVFAKARCLDPQKLEIAKAKIKKLESAGIIRRSKSPWASPLHMVPQKRWIMVGGNYRCLNMITTPDKYPLSNMQDLSNNLDGWRPHL